MGTLWRVDLLGYADRLSVALGSEISFMVSSEADHYRAHLVRLIHGDTNPAGPGFKACEVMASFAGEHPGVTQQIRTGSYVRVPHATGLARADFTIALWFLATVPNRATQTLISKRDPDGSGYALGLHKGRVMLQLDGESLTLDQPVLPRVWYFVAASYDATSREARLVLTQTSGVALDGPATATARLAPPAAATTADLLIAAEALPGGSGLIGHFYNGKIDGPTFLSRALAADELSVLGQPGTAPPAARAVVAWDFSQEISTWRIVDRGGNGHHGVAVNTPMRGATGHNWTGAETAWPSAPEQYGAIHFHDDDLADAGWERAFTWNVPDDLDSGVYAVQLADADGNSDLIPFAITPRLGRPQAEIALVLPTFSYLAYGNEQGSAPGNMFAIPGYPSTAEDSYILDNGLRSLYDHHTDESGVCYASWLRPLMNVRPMYRAPFMDNFSGAPHQLAADLHLVDWLDHCGYRVDVLTDLELDREGVDRLRDYRVVLTGTHCEYWSFRMLSAALAYLRDGGRLMYLAGNGMYWVVALDTDTGTGIELRRRGPADQTWQTQPGEAHLSSTGELGGVWRYRGHSPQSWLGVGYFGAGGAPGRSYDRQPDSFDPRAAFVFEGIGDDEAIGDFPCLVNRWGAAGHEVDHVDHELGTPLHTLRLASATDFDPAARWGLPNEENINAQDPVARLPQADMTLTAYPQGGAVFSTGSVTWCGCLSYNDYDNNVARITRNVLERFLADGAPGR